MANGSNGAGKAARVKQAKAGKGKASPAKLRKGRYKPNFSKLSPDTDVPF